MYASSEFYKQTYLSLLHHRQFPNPAGYNQAVQAGRVQPGQRSRPGRQAWAAGLLRALLTEVDELILGPIIRVLTFAVADRAFANKITSIADLFGSGQPKRKSIWSCAGTRPSSTLLYSANLSTPSMAERRRQRRALLSATGEDGNVIKRLDSRP
jgi:hypothetical protein